ncbi:biotin-requiring enzyme domain-containing protein [Toxoplasma gondii CAST]|uniref:Biotin-requiring enzyme domain-containing protein n=1 Tax=Toxoplasma gondii CAST TaxID=943122 RepID=A0A425I8G1_TOXGO|nr:biotin-requiring enzyme domain-containing protein [Toxoplasma gondii CAST]
MPPLSFFLCLRVPFAPVFHPWASKLLSVHKHFHRTIRHNLASFMQQTRTDSRHFVRYVVGIAKASATRARDNQVATVIDVGSSKGPSSTEIIPEGYTEEPQGIRLYGEATVPDPSRSSSVGADECIEETFPHIVAHAFLENSPATKIRIYISKRQENTFHSYGNSKVIGTHDTCAVRFHTFRFATAHLVLSEHKSGELEKTERGEDGGSPAKPAGTPSHTAAQEVVKKGTFHDELLSEENIMKTVNDRQGIPWRIRESRRSLHTECRSQPEDGTEPSGRPQLHESAKRLLFALSSAVMTIHEHKRTLEATAAAMGIPPALCFQYPGANSSSPLSPVSPISALLSKMPWADFTGFRVNLPTVPVDFHLTVSASIAIHDHQQSEVPSKTNSSCRLPHTVDPLCGKASFGVSREEQERNSAQPAPDVPVVGNAQFSRWKEAQTRGVVCNGNGDQLLAEQQAFTVTARVWVLEVPSASYSRKSFVALTSDLDGQEAEQAPRHSETIRDTVLTNRMPYEDNRAETSRPSTSPAWKPTKGSTYRFCVCLAEDDHVKKSASDKITDNVAKETEAPFSDTAATQTENVQGEDYFGGEGAMRVTAAVDAEGRLVYNVEETFCAYSGVAEVGTEETDSFAEENFATRRETKLVPALIITTSQQSGRETVYLRAAVSTSPPFDSGASQREIEECHMETGDSFSGTEHLGKTSSAERMDDPHDGQSLSGGRMLGAKLPLGKVLTSFTYRDDPEGARKQRNVCEVRAPMNGTVIKVAVKEGEHVTKNALLAVMEAMKMETVIRSPYNGIVTSVRSREGVSTKQGQSLLEILEDPEREQ